MDDQTLGAFGKLFVERRDVFAEQHRDGSYAPVKRPIKLGDLRDHVEGRKSYGHYLVSTEGRCRLFAFDIDFVKGRQNPENLAEWLPLECDGKEYFPREAFFDANSFIREKLMVELNCLAEGLARRTRRTLGIQVAVSYSGRKGMHVYGFTGPEKADVVRDAADNVLKSFGAFEPSKGKNFWKHTDAYEAFEIEVFPKQTQVGKDGFGNLMRFPLGKHAVTGNESHFVMCEPPPNRITPMPAEAAIAGRVPWTE